MSKKQELIDRVLNDLENNWVVSKQDILSLIDFLTEAQVNRYWLFEDESYESANGAECITKCSDNIEELKPQYPDSPNGWWHIFDAQEGLILKGDDRDDFYPKDNNNNPKLAKCIRVSKEDAGNKELIDHIIQHKHDKGTT